MHADNVALPTFARRRCRVPAMQHSIDISCLQGPQQQTCSSRIASFPTLSCRSSPPLPFPPVNYLFHPLPPSLPSPFSTPLPRIAAVGPCCDRRTEKRTMLRILCEQCQQNSRIDGGVLNVARSWHICSRSRQTVLHIYIDYYY